MGETNNITKIIERALERDYASKLFKNGPLTRMGVMNQLRVQAAVDAKYPGENTLKEARDLFEYLLQEGHVYESTAGHYDSV